MEPVLDKEFVREIRGDLALAGEILPLLLASEKGEEKQLLEEVAREFAAISDLLAGP